MSRETDLYVQEMFYRLRIPRCLKLELLDHCEPPEWLRMTAADKRRAVDFARRVASEYPVLSLDDLLWCLFFDTIRPRRRGRPSKWLGAIDLAIEIERVL